MPDPIEAGATGGLEAEVRRLRGLLDDATERLERVRRDAAAEHARLTFELGHRVKNTLSVVQSLAGQTWRNAVTREEALDVFGGRIISLSRANDIILGQSWTSISIRPLVEGVLGPFGTPTHRLTIDGPEVRLPASAALAFAMALHDLAVNAQRHGAWSVEGGGVALAWATDGDPPAFTLGWTESGGPPAAPPDRKGFGLRLIEQSLKSAFGRDVVLDFGPGGLRVAVRAALAAITA